MILQAAAGSGVSIPHPPARQRRSFRVPLHDNAAADAGWAAAERGQPQGARHAAARERCPLVAGGAGPQAARGGGPGGRGPSGRTWAAEI